MQTEGCEFGLSQLTIGNLIWYYPFKIEVAVPYKLIHSVDISELI